MPPNVRDSRRFRLFAANRRKCVNIGGERGSKVGKSRVQKWSACGRKCCSRGVFGPFPVPIWSAAAVLRVCCACVLGGFPPESKQPARKSNKHKGTQAHTRCQHKCCLQEDAHTTHKKYTQKWDATRNGPQGERSVANRALPLKNMYVCRLVCESLSMKFQASRFSASGRRVPLEPRSARRTAYASPCMFSRLERDVVGVFCWVVPMRRSVTHVWGAIRVQWPRLLLKTCLVIICFTLRLRGSRRLQLLEWRFDGCVSSNFFAWDHLRAEGRVRRTCRKGRNVK